MENIFKEIQTIFCSDYSFKYKEEEIALSDCNFERSQLAVCNGEAPGTFKFLQTLKIYQQFLGLEYANDFLPLHSRDLYSLTF